MTTQEKKRERKAFFLDMMNDVQMTPIQATTEAIQESNGDTWDPFLDKSTLIEKNKELKRSKYIHLTLIDGTGTIIQFINSQPAHSPGAGEVFGGVWINLNDLERVPRYLNKYESAMQHHARLQLEEHLKQANHPGGLFEELTDVTSASPWRGAPCLS